MKPTTRKWGFRVSVAVFILSAAAFTFASRYLCGYSKRPVIVGAGYGALYVQVWQGGRTGTGWFFDKTPPPANIVFWPAILVETLLFVLYVPLWMIAAVGVALMIYFRPKRGRTLGHCSRCDYDLTGNESAVCPECGTPVVPAATDG